MIVLGLLLIVAALALGAAVMSDGTETQSLDIFGVDVSTSAAGLFGAGAATMLGLVLGVWLVQSALNRKRRRRQERKVAERERKESVSRLEAEKAELADRLERERAERDARTAPVSPADHDDRPVVTGTTGATEATQASSGGVQGRLRSLIGHDGPDQGSGSDSASPHSALHDSSAGGAEVTETRTVRSQTTTSAPTEVVHEERKDLRTGEGPDRRI